MNCERFERVEKRELFLYNSKKILGKGGSA
jgi:hypothetical protein